MAANDIVKETGNPQPTKMQLIGYLIVIPAVFTTLMTIVLGFSLGVFSFEPQVRALQSFGHGLPLVGPLIPAPAPLPQDTERLSLSEEKQAVQLEWEKIDAEKKKIEQRSKDLDQRTKALAEAAQKLSEGEQDKENRSARLQKTVDSIAAMKADDAARLLSELPDATTVELLTNMDTSQISKILAAMDAKRAAAITQLMRR